MDLPLFADGAEDERDLSGQKEEALPAGRGKEALLNLDELPPETLSPEGVEDVAASQKVDPLELREGGCHRRDHLRGCSQGVGGMDVEVGVKVHRGGCPNGLRRPS